MHKKPVLIELSVVLRNTFIRSTQLLLIMSLCGCGFRWVQFPTVYSAGDNITGERLELNPGGDFIYKRWQDHYRESVEGSYEHRGFAIVLNSAIYDDSLSVQERIAANDSTRIKVEIWDGRFKNKINDFTNIQLRLLNKNAVVAEAWAEQGQAIFDPNIIFDAWQITSSGYLLQKNYYKKHPKSNFFYAQFRFGNLKNTHLHFDNTHWNYSPKTITSKLRIEGKKKVVKMEKEEQGG